MSEPRSALPPASSERLVTFTDAVSAIALTLLVLPLLETISDLSAETTLTTLIHGHLEQFGAFVLSFAVIFRLWWAHHRIFRHIETINTALVRWSMVWTFAIVLLPIPTAIITAYHPSAGSVALYGGNLALATGAMSLVAWSAWRRPELSGDRPPVTRDELLTNVIAFIVQLIATAIGAVFYDSINFFAFLLMFLSGPVHRLLGARRRRAGR